jgi:hypothetical protein
MAVEVIQAGPSEVRARQVLALITGVMFASFALAPYPQGYPDWGYLDLWWIRLPLLLVATPFFYLAHGLLRPVTLPLLEIRRDSIRWTYEGEECTIARAAVSRARADAVYISFVPALEERVPPINILSFDKKAVRNALERQGWTSSSPPSTF